MNGTVSCDGCFDANVEIATLSIPAVFDVDRPDPVVLVGPVVTLPSGVVRVDFSPWPYSNGMCRLPLLRRWGQFNRIIVGDPCMQRSYVFPCEACKTVGELVVDTRILNQFMTEYTHRYLEFHFETVSDPEALDAGVKD